MNLTDMEIVHPSVEGLEDYRNSPWSGGFVRTRVRVWVMFLRAGGASSGGGGPSCSKTPSGVPGDPGTAPSFSSGGASGGLRG